MRDRPALLGSTATAVAVKFGATGLRLQLLLVLGVQLEAGMFARLSLAFSLAELARYALDFGSDAWMQRESGRRTRTAAARLATGVGLLRAAQFALVLPPMLLLLTAGFGIDGSLSAVLLLGSATQASLVFLLHRHQSVDAAGPVGRPVLVLMAGAALPALAVAWQGQALAAFAMLLAAECASIALLARRAVAVGVLQAPGTSALRHLRRRLARLWARTQAFAWIALFGLVYGRIDLWLLQWADAGTDWVARYSLAFRVMELPWILVAGVLSSLGAQLAARHRLRASQWPASPAVSARPLIAAAAAAAASMMLYGLLAAFMLQALGRALPPALLAAMTLLFTVKLANIVVYSQLAAAGLERRSVHITLAACALQGVAGACCLSWFGPWGIVLSTHAVEWALLILQWRALAAARRAPPAAVNRSSST
jgi:hypothetical protein